MFIVHDGSGTARRYSTIDQLVNKQGVKRTQLMWAACQGDVDTVRDLIARGATIDIATKNGLTALMFAAHNGHTDTVAELLRSGAHVDRADNNGKTALMFAQKSHRTHTVEVIQSFMERRNRVTPVVNNEEEDADIYNLAKATMFSAAMIGRIDIVNQILTCHKEYIHATDADGKTLLMLAAEEGHVDTIQELLYTHGANPDAVDCQGRSALDHAMQRSHIQAVELIENFCKMQTAPIIVEEGSSAAECQICLSNKPNIAFIPCGHGTCDSCCDDLMRSKEPTCHICRDAIEKTLKLYL